MQRYKYKYQSKFEKNTQRYKYKYQSKFEKNTQRYKYKYQSKFDKIHRYLCVNFNLNLKEALR